MKTSPDDLFIHFWVLNLWYNLSKYSAIPLNISRDILL